MQWAFPPAFLLGQLSGRPAAQKASFSFWVLHFMHDDARPKGRESWAEEYFKGERVWAPPKKFLFRTLDGGGPNIWTPVAFAKI